MRRTTVSNSPDVGHYEPAEPRVMLAGLLIAVLLFVLSVLLGG
jgi:hypothetical protein